MLQLNSCSSGTHRTHAAVLTGRVIAGVCLAAVSDCVVITLARVVPRLPLRTLAVVEAGVRRALVGVGLAVGALVAVPTSAAVLVVLVEAGA